MIEVKIKDCMVLMERNFGPHLARILSLKASRSGTISDFFNFYEINQLNFDKYFYKGNSSKNLNLLNGKFLNKMLPRDI
jgi:hypothetical protein